MSYDKIHRPNIFNDIKDDILLLISNAYMEDVNEITIEANKLSNLDVCQITELVNFLTKANYNIVKNSNSYTISGW